MSDSIKQIRGQVRQIVKEILPTVLAEEIVRVLYASLQKHVDQRLDGITNHVKSSLDAIDTRAKEVQSYLVRANTPSAPSTPKE